MKAGRRVLFSLMVVLMPLSAPSVLPAHAEGVASQSISLRGGINPQGNCQTGSVCGC